MKSIIATVNEGEIRGIKEKSHYFGTEYYAFYGVPYGQPTGSELRYQDPVKVEPWDGVYDATTPKGGCSQFHLGHCVFMGTEDCLYSNIYTSKLPSSEDEPLRPVIVNIHPGGHVYNSPDPTECGSADFVMQHDIVYVGIAHRLHIFGFLNLGMEECSGNQGIKDIIMGLQWLQQNVRTFGGDPDNITMIGGSSGSEIIHLLMLSPKSKGLFHKIVFMGMYGFNPVVYRRNADECEKMAFKIARGIGFRGDDKRKLLIFLKKAPAQQLLIEMRNLKKSDPRVAEVYTCGPFHPTVDQGETAVLPVPPMDLLPSMSRLPVIFGICEREGVIGFCGPLNKVKTHRKLVSTYTQNIWSWGSHLDKDDIAKITKKVESFYCNGQPLEKAPLATRVDLQTDIGFCNVYDTLIDIISADLPTSAYVYKFEYEGSLQTSKAILTPLLDEPLDGTFHSADYNHWGCLGGPSGIANCFIKDETVEFIHTFTKLVTTFAKTGNPNFPGLETEWKPSTPEKPCYLRIKKSLELVYGKLNHERMEFWENIKKELRND